MSPRKKKEQTEIVEEVVEDNAVETIEVVKEEVTEDPGKVRFLFYEKLRVKFTGNLPQDSKVYRIRDYLFLLPDYFILLCRLLLEEKVTKETKAFILGVIAYVMLPIDLIPDFIPVIGFIDDLILVVFALDQIMKNTDEKILLANWSGRSDFLLSIKNIIDLADSAVTHQILMKIKIILKKLRLV